MEMSGDHMRAGQKKRDRGKCIRRKDAERGKMEKRDREDVKRDGEEDEKRWRGR